MFLARGWFRVLGCQCFVYVHGKPAAGEENFILEHLINPGLTMIEAT